MYLVIFSLENNSQGGVNIVLNLMLKKEIAAEREQVKHQCGNCERVYYKEDVVRKEENFNFQGYFPDNGVCTDVSIF